MNRLFGQIWYVLLCIIPIWDFKTFALKFKRLAKIIDKGVLTEPDSLLTWHLTYRQYIEVKRRIQTLLDEKHGLSEFLSAIFMVI